MIQCCSGWLVWIWTYKCRLNHCYIQVDSICLLIFIWNLLGIRIKSELAQWLYFGRWKDIELKEFINFWILFFVIFIMAIWLLLFYSYQLEEIDTLGHKCFIKVGPSLHWRNADVVNIRCYLVVIPSVLQEVEFHFKWLKFAFFCAYCQLLFLRN